eukprot:4256560-Amphidinium_carterae.1
MQVAIETVSPTTPHACSARSLQPLGQISCVWKKIALTMKGQSKKGSPFNIPRAALGGRFWLMRAVHHASA